MNAPFDLRFNDGTSSKKNVADVLLQAAHKQPTSGIWFPEGGQITEASGAFVSYRSLLEEVRRILGGLNARKYSVGTTVALLLERPRDFIPAFWACVLGGYVPCPVAPIRGDPKRQLQHFNHIEHLLDHPLLITTTAWKDEVPTRHVADLHTLRAGFESDGVHQARAAEPAVLMLTSGSTGNSKAVELTHGNLLASMEGKAASQNLTDKDIVLNWIAFDHVAALLETHMIAQYVGATQVHVEPAVVLEDPISFLRLIDRYAVTLAFVPNFLLGQINSILESRKTTASSVDDLNLNLKKLRYIVTGGEANVVDTGRRFLDGLRTSGLARNALRPAFGMTETSAASVYSHEFPECDEGREFAAVGSPIAGFEMRIVSENGVPLPLGEPGELQVRGSMVFGRYLNNAESTKTAFSTDGWFRTGDLGRIEEGRLRLLGRSKDCIIVSGVNYFSQELETALESLEGIERSYVAAFPKRPKGADTEQLVVAFATSFSLEDEIKLYQLAVAVRNTTIMLWGFRPATILPLPKDAFPKTSLGKIQRTLMRKRLEAGEYSSYEDHISRVTACQLGKFAAAQGTVESRIAEIYGSILGIAADSVSATSSFFDLGGTSLEILKLTKKLANTLGIHVSVAEVLQNPTVRGLALYAERATESKKLEYDPIVAMQLTGSGTPLFCVHPGNGGVLIFVSLAKYFVNERPFYALRPRGFNKGEEFFATFDEMVETYLEAISTRQPHGPYALAGYSVGCPIAFEIARRLEERGERVSFLGCIDEGPSESWPSSDLLGSAIALAYVLGLLGSNKAMEMDRALRSSGPTLDPCQQVFEQGRRERIAELDLDLPKFSAWASVALSNHTLVRAAHVTRGLVESVTVFCSSGWDDEPREEWHNQLHRWDAYSRGPNRYIDVAGNHLDMMGPKHVAAFQATLRAEIVRAMEAL